MVKGSKMILSGKEIEKRIDKDIFISPFDKKQLNPNSYNIKLHNELMVYHEIELDMKRKLRTKTLKIPENGLLLKPGVLYLGRTYEHTKTKNLVPMIEGRSSIGRLGIFIHATAGFGDVGFEGYWTLEISCIQPVIIYPFVEIAQIYYHTIQGEFDEYKNGKYQKNKNIQPSFLYKEFNE